MPKEDSGKGGEHKGGRRRVASTGSDPDEDEEEEQEDESPRRVIVVTETDVDKRVGLRSLLKSPNEPVDKENRDRGRNVSFLMMSQSIFSIRYVKGVYTEKQRVPSVARFHIVKLFCYFSLF